MQMVGMERVERGWIEVVDLMLNNPLCIFKGNELWMEHVGCC